MHSICEWTDFLCRQFFLSLQARLQVSLQTGKKKLTLAFPGPSQRHSAFLSLPASRFEFQCKDIKEIQKHIQFGSSGPGGLHHPVWAHRVRSWLPLMTRCFQVPGVQENALFQPEAARCHWQSETPRSPWPPLSIRPYRCRSTLLSPRPWRLTGESLGRFGLLSCHVPDPNELKPDRWWRPWTSSMSQPLLE